MSEIMKRILWLMCLLLPVWGMAQEMKGKWSGTLDVGGHTLRVVFRFSPADEGWKVTMDSPDQGAFGIPVDSVKVGGGAVTLQLPRLGIRYEGTVMTPSMVMGTFTQNGVDYMMPLAKQTLRRPQTPRPPFPYRSENVTFESRDEGVELHGTLTRPASEEVKAVVVLVTGSGLQNRDEEIFEHRPFAVLADRLTREGYAVLRYDDRGYGASPEVQACYAAATTANFREDALGAVDFVKRDPQLAQVPCGIMGHSEGGTIAFMAAAAERKVDFIVSLAGSMLSGDKVLEMQAQHALRHLPDELRGQMMTVRKRIVEVARAYPFEELAARHDELRRELEALPELRRLPREVGDVLSFFDALAASAWLHAFVCYDPAEAIAACDHLPVLALNGDKDTQVDAAAHLGRLRELLKGNGRLVAKVVPDCNHLFQPCVTGEVAEYEELETTMAEVVLEAVVEWLDCNAVK